MEIVMNSLGRISTATFFNSMSKTTVDQESSMYAIQKKLSTGKNINQPSDDPLGAAQLSIIKDQLAQNSVYKNSIVSAQNSIQASSSAVGDALGALQSTFQLAVQARNGAYSPSDLKNIGATLRGILGQLVQTANAQDGQGNYLFAGSQTQTQPFQFSGSNYQYSGDQTVAFARTGAATLTQTSWTGANLFEGAFNGDGIVQATANASNAGDGVVSKVVQSAPGSYNGDQYSVAFSLSGTQLQATITNVTTSTVVSGPTNFTSGQSLSFAGVNLTLDGTPNAGDTFNIDNAQRFNVLDSLAQLANVLENAGTLSKSQIQNGLAAGQAELLAAVTNLTSEAALMGAEISSLSLAQTTIEDRGISLEAARSGYEDVDLAQAINDFTAQKTALTASLQSFASISGLSLFNYLR